MSKNSKVKGERFLKELKNLTKGKSWVKEVRGAGLWVCVEINKGDKVSTD
jgi:4-aminobutyrate aminotransferase-like enzyme